MQEVKPDYNEQLMYYGFIKEHEKGKWTWYVKDKDMSIILNGDKFDSKAACKEVAGRFFDFYGMATLEVPFEE